MSDESLPKSVWSGSFTIFGVEMKCHVLDTGQRIIEAESIARFFDCGFPIDGTSEEMNAAIQEFAAFTRGKGLP